MKPSILSSARLRLSAALVTAALTPTLHAFIDGFDDGTEGYITIATQTHAPAWGNANFLGNFKAVQDANNLNVLLSGRTDGNAFLLFIDSKPGGVNVIPTGVITSGGEEETINNLAGFTFESGFTADFAVRIFGSATGAFHNLYDFSTGVRTYAGNALGANISSGFVADGRTSWISAGADPTAQIDGVELALDLESLGVPTGTQDIKLFALLINGQSNYASNQMLGSQDGPAVIEGAITTYNLETEPGVQTLTVSVDAANPDNDGDGLLNSVENNTGEFIDENMTGTDPDDADSDDDLLSDGDEVKTFGTDPNKADTDEDGANDATEISLGSDPLNGPIPSGGMVDVIGFDFFDYSDGGINNATGFETRVFDIDNSSANDAFIGHGGAVAPWTTSFGTEVLCNRLVTSNGSSASRNFNGVATGGTDIGRVENVSAISAKSVYAKVTIRRDGGATYGGLSFLKDGAEVAFAGVRDTLNGENRNFGVEISGEEGAGFTGDVPADRTTYCLVAKLDTENEKIQIWVDPALGGAEPAADAEATFVNDANAVASGIRLSSGGAEQTFWDDLVVTTSWDALDAADPTDSEPDGLRDSWEEVYSPGDLDQLASGRSADGDLLNDDEEQTVGTNPLEQDTDLDDLDDDVETNTGMFLSESNTGTDPCDPDTDGDTLSDGDEVLVHNTDPTNVDSDNDLESDGFEIFQNTDPNKTSENSTSLGLVKIDGSRDDLYGTPIVVQTVDTEFGDNQSELDAAYAKVQDGKLYILLTGNLQDNFNKLEIFIDSKAGGQEQFISAGNDGASAMDGMFFDLAFAADYHLIARRGGDKFDLDFADLVAKEFDFYEDILAGGDSGFGSTGTGVNMFPIRVGYDGSNTAGVGGGTGAADQEAAAAVTTGLEFCINLADLGSPSGSLQVMAFINNDSHSFMSNQTLAGLPPGTGNLGNPAAIDFDTVAAGDQFFIVELVEAAGSFTISDVQIVNGGTQLQLTLRGLTIGNNYKFQSSTTLKTDSSPGAFEDILGSTFNATSTSEVRTVAITPGSVQKLFVRGADAP